MTLEPTATRSRGQEVTKWLVLDLCVLATSARVRTETTMVVVARLVIVRAEVRGTGLIPLQEPSW